MPLRKPYTKHDYYMSSYKVKVLFFSDIYDIKDFIGKYDIGLFLKIKSNISFYNRGESKR